MTKTFPAVSSGGLRLCVVDWLTITIPFHVRLYSTSISGKPLLESGQSILIIITLARISDHRPFFSISSFFIQLVFELAGHQALKRDLGCEIFI
jgi:hypothetical protein